MTDRSLIQKWLDDKVDAVGRQVHASLRDALRMADLAGVGLIVSQPVLESVDDDVVAFTWGIRPDPDHPGQVAFKGLE